MKIIVLAAALALCAAPAFAQTTATPTVPGSIDGTGTYTPYSTTNPAPVAPVPAPSGSATPAAGTAHAIVTGGVAVTAVTGPVHGCYIVNPLTATDEGIVTAEPLYVNPVAAAGTTGNNTTSALAPGQAFNCVPGQSTNVSANASTSSHAFVVVKW